MRIIARPALTDFAGRHPKSRSGLERWYHVTKHATWRTPDEVRLTFSGTKVVGGDRVRFEIHGGDFRLVVAFDFRRQIAFIKFVGTHAEYDRIDAATV